MNEDGSGSSPSKRIGSLSSRGKKERKEGGKMNHDPTAAHMIMVCAFSERNSVLSDYY